MAEKEVKIKFTIDGIEKEVTNLEDFTKEMKKAGVAAKDAGEEATIFGDLKDKFNDATKGVRKVIAGMKTLKGAVMSTGIGALVVALGSLIEYFRSSEEGSRKLAIATETLSLLWGELSEFAQSLGEKIAWVFENPKEALISFKDLLVANITERIESLIDMFGYLGSAIMKVFKGDFSGALEDAKAAGSEFVDTMTGVDNTIGKVAETAVETFNTVKKAVNEAIEVATVMVDLTRAIRDQQQALTVANAELNRELELQQRIAEDTTLTYDERKAALERVAQAQLQLAENVAAQARNEEKLLKLQIENESNYEKREELESQLADATAARIEAETALAITEQEVGKIGRELDLEELERKRGIRDILQELGQQELEDAFDQARQELDILEQQKMEELAMLKASEEEITAAKQAFSDKRKAIDKAESDYTKALKKAQVENDLQLASQALGAIGGLLAEGSKAQKAAAIAAATIDTYLAAQKAYTSQIIPGDPTSVVRASIAAGVAIASGVANVQKILSTPLPEGGGGGGSAGGGVPSRPSAPTFNPDAALAGAAEAAGGGTGSTVTSQQQGSQNVIKAYVVATEVTSQQEANSQIENLAKL